MLSRSAGTRRRVLVDCDQQRGNGDVLNHKVHEIRRSADCLDSVRVGLGLTVFRRE